MHVDWVCQQVCVCQFLPIEFMITYSIVLTLILAFWLRFEYQACRYLPWMILARQPKTLKPIHIRRNDAACTITLDYPSLWTPSAILTAAKNKHFLVLSTLLTSMLLRVQVVLSSSLFYIHLVNTTRTVEVGLRDQFGDWTYSNSSFNIFDSRPYRLESGNWTTPLEYPQYLLPGVALQNFDDSSLTGMENSTTLAVTIDGVVIESSCENSSVLITPAKNGSTFAISPHHRLPSRSFQIDIYPSQLLTGAYLLYYWEDTSHENESSQPFYMALAIAGEQNMGKTSFRTTAMSCTLDTQVYPFDVVVENLRLSAARHPEVEAARSIQGRLLDSMWRSYPNPSQIVPGDQSFQNGLLGVFVPGNIMDVEVTPYFTPDPIPFKVGGWLLRNGSLNGSEFVDPAILGEVMRLYHSIYGSLVVHYDYRMPISQDSTSGTVTVALSRLGVQPYITHAMTGIFGFIMVLTLPLLLDVSSKDGFVPFKPHTLAGIATLLCKSPEFISDLNYSGHQPLKELVERTRGIYCTTLIHHPWTPLYPSFQLQRLKNQNTVPPEGPPREPKVIDWYQPWTLHPASRTFGVLATIGFLMTLVALMQNSLRLDGLGDAIDGNTAHYLWTSLPSLLFISLSTYFGSCDSELRSLAPFVLLSSKAVSYNEGLALSFMDQSAVRALVKSVKKRHLTVALSTSIVLICSLLPIFTASLFTVRMGSTSKTIALQQTEWFTPNKFEPQVDKLADLILNANLSYPQWTFEDLVMPQYQLGETVESSDIPPDSIITSQLRAARAVLNCRHSTSTGNISMEIHGEQVICNPSGLVVCPMDPSQAFGLDPQDVRWLCDLNNSTSQWPPLMYAWGRCQKDPYDGSLWGSESYVTVLICNETFEEVEAKVTLLGPDLQIPETHPPILTGSSGRPITLDFSEPLFDSMAPYDVPSLYNNLVSNDGAGLGLFGTLTGSRYALSQEWLGDVSRNDDIIAAIKKIHGIVRAQMLRGSAGAWRNLNDTSTVVPPVDGEIWRTAPRVIQNGTATYALVGLLAAITVLNVLLVWISEKHGYRRAVPKPPGSIVAVVSLFANSTFFAHLPPHAQWATNQKLEQHFEGKRFRMGWFTDNIADEGAVFTIGVVDGTSHEGR